MAEMPVSQPATGDALGQAPKAAMHPYAQLQERAFWATAVARRDMMDIADLWRPKFRIDPQMKVATFGSCFSQRIGRALAGQGFNWFIAERAPSVLGPESRAKFNYDVFSARTGNIYTASLLKQWVAWASGQSPPDEIWEQDGRFFDPFRPNIEPNGFVSREELLASRRVAIRAFRDVLDQSGVLVFTLGLTESWFNAEHGYEYPMCPGTVAGTFDAEQHLFINQDHDFVRAALGDAIAMMHAINPELRILLTVSPVPQIATMTGNHVLVASMESKSTLRVVAGAIARTVAFVDYFPSFEMVNSPPYRGVFFGDNKRTITMAGIDHVMAHFMACLMPAAIAAKPEAPQPVVETKSADTDDDICDEILLEAFAPDQ